MVVRVRVRHAEADGHAIQERLQREIWTNLKIGTTHIKGRPFPDKFRKDVESGLFAVMQKYEDTVAELTPRKLRTQLSEFPAPPAATE